MLEIETWSSGRASSAFTHWTISLAQARRGVWIFLSFREQYSSYQKRRYSYPIGEWYRIQNIVYGRHRYASTDVWLFLDPEGFMLVEKCVALTALVSISVTELDRHFVAWNVSAPQTKSRKYDAYVSGDIKRRKSPYLAPPSQLAGYLNYMQSSSSLHCLSSYFCKVQAIGCLLELQIASKLICHTLVTKWLGITVIWLFFGDNCDLVIFTRGDSSLNKN